MYITSQQLAHVVSGGRSTMKVIEIALFGVVIRGSLDSEGEQGDAQFIAVDECMDLSKEDSGTIVTTILMETGGGIMEEWWK